MHARGCVPTAADGISPRPRFAWPSPKNVWFFTAANTPDEIRKTLQSTALDLGPKGIDDQFGAGLADAGRAVLSLGVAEARAAPEARVVPATLFAERWPEIPQVPFPWRQ